MRSLIIALFPKPADAHSLAELDPGERAAQASWSRVLPLSWDPPPNYLFDRDTQLQLAELSHCVHAPDGEINVVDPDALRLLESILDGAVHYDTDATAARLVEIAQQAGAIVTTAEVTSALSTGTWPEERDGLRGAILQAAGFAHHLREAAKLAMERDEALAWIQTGGQCDHAYPPGPRELPGLGFLNQLSGTLRIELSEPARPVSERVMNLVADQTATIKSMSLALTVFLRPSKTFRELTDEELAYVVVAEPRLRLCGEGSDEPVEHQAPNGVAFTVRDLVDAIVTTERQSRAASNWMGGIDVHHIFFEGIGRNEDGTWSISWGS